MRLDELVESFRDKKLSPQEIEEQRISYALGNSAAKDHATIESVRAASTILKEAKKQ